MMYYAGVMTEAQIEEESRVIQFPRGEYLVVKGEDKTAKELSNKLTGIAFGQALPKQRILPTLVNRIQRLRWDREMA